MLEKVIWRHNSSVGKNHSSPSLTDAYVSSISRLHSNKPGDTLCEFCLALSVKARKVLDRRSPDLLISRDTFGGVMIVAGKVEVAPGLVNGATSDWCGTW